MIRFTVVAAVIFDDDGRILLTKRAEDTHMGGLWEFPGGKVENGESYSGALVRELHEELGISVETGRPLTFAIHKENNLEILLLFFSAVITDGRPRSLEGQEILWVRSDELTNYPMPPADDEVVEMLVRSGFNDVATSAPHFAVIIADDER